MSSELVAVCRVDRGGQWLGLCIYDVLGGHLIVRQCFVAGHQRHARSGRRQQAGAVQRLARLCLNTVLVSAGGHGCVLALVHAYQSIFYPNNSPLCSSFSLSLCELSLLAFDPGHCTNALVNCLPLHPVLHHSRHNCASVSNPFSCDRPFRTGIEPALLTSAMLAVAMLCRVHFLQRVDPAVIQTLRRRRVLRSHRAAAQAVQQVDPVNTEAVVCIQYP